jgi:serine-type D-Ala-D-Ala carboxypeptidase/endopeptidase
MNMRSPTLKQAIYLSLYLALAGCGGGAQTDVPPPAPAPAPAPDPGLPPPGPKSGAWDKVKAELDAFSVGNAAIIVGTASGVRLRYEKGSFKLTDRHAVASASKMMAGLTILKLVEDGRMSMSDHPQKYLSYWTTDPADRRSRVTLGQLLGFTSGFNITDTPGGCVSEPATTLQLCAREYYDQGVNSEPGSAFGYSNGHLEIAGAMAEIAGGQPFSTLFRDKVANPLGMGVTSGIVFPSTANPRPSGGGVSTGEEYAKMLEGVLDNRLLSNLTNFTTDQTTAVTFLFRPQGTFDNGDWHYAAASWRECDVTPYNATCAAQKLISSPGAFGWTPWIDFDKGYYAIICMEGPTGSSTISIALEQKLQPLIEAALAAGG